jgi:glycosyltransferase involved in cell wall biosynthesis
MENRKLRKIVIVNFASAGGGAHIAATRIHEALLKFGPELMVESSLRTIKSKNFSTQSKHGYPNLPFYDCLVRNIRIFSRKVKQWLYRILGGRGLFSFASIRTGLADEISGTEADLILLNWLGEYTESLDALQVIEQPIVIRTADFWFLRGSSHFPDYAVSEWQTRWSQILDSLFFRIGDTKARVSKKNFLENKVQAVVAPSRWMLRHVERDELLSLKSHYSIPNPVDTSFWRPNSSGAREQTYRNRPTIRLLHGAIGGTRYPWKGGDLLQLLCGELGAFAAQPGSPSFELHTFGGNPPRLTADSIPVIPHGLLEPEQLRDLYSASDLFLQTSRVETFGNTVIEAMACGTAIAAFNVGPIEELVQNGVSGILVPAFDTSLLAAEILRYVSTPNWLQDASDAARRSVLQSFSEYQVAKQYADFIHHESP